MDDPLSWQVPVRVELNVQEVKTAARSTSGEGAGAGAWGPRRGETPFGFRRGLHARRQSGSSRES
eukprot:8083300-Lingulodinium_polyedra.AAC.1